MVVTNLTSQNTINYLNALQKYKIWIKNQMPQSANGVGHKVTKKSENIK